MSTVAMCYRCHTPIGVNDPDECSWPDCPERDHKTAALREKELLERIDVTETDRNGWRGRAEWAEEKLAELEWRPIETYTQGGRVLLAIAGEPEMTSMGSYLRDKAKVQPRYTHWMPIPSAPEKD